MYRGTDYYGEARVGRTPATPYIYIGRVRSRADQPDGYRRGHGVTGPFTPATPGDLLAEPTIMVPFGTRNYVALMTPMAGATRVAAVQAWMTATMGLVTTGDRLELLPIVDLRVLEKLDQAVGASRLTVRIPAGAAGQMPPEGGGEVGEAIREATHPAGDLLDVEVSYSLGNRRGTGAVRDQVLAAARWIARAGTGTRAEVSIQLPEGEGLRTEVHNVFRDTITAEARFTVPDGEPPSEQSVLTGINEAIEEFRRRA